MCWSNFSPTLSTLRATVFNKILASACWLVFSRRNLFSATTTGPEMIATTIGTQIASMSHPTGPHWLGVVAVDARIRHGLSLPLSNGRAVEVALTVRKPNVYGLDVACKANEPTAGHFLDLKGRSATLAGEISHQ
jgi:hypothetical protein